MEDLLEFAKGPLFRLCFAIMILGLIRVLVLDLLSIIKAYRKAGDKKIPWLKVISRGLGWLFPINKVYRNRPVYSIFSIIFHIGLLLVPVFLLAHIQLWESSIGISWPALTYEWAYALTIITIICGLALLIGRTLNKTSSFLSRKQDFLWPVLLLIPFVTGFLCAHLSVNPGVYNASMLVHVLAGNLIFLLIPFTKIAHCVLMPLSQIVCAVAWKFPPDTDEKITTTLNKKGAPV